MDNIFCHLDAYLLSGIIFLMGFCWDLLSGQFEGRGIYPRTRVNSRDLPELHAGRVGILLFISLVSFSNYTGCNPFAFFHNVWLELASGYISCALFAYVLVGTSSRYAVNDSADSLDLDRSLFALWKAGERDGTNLALEQVRTRTESVTAFPADR